MTGGVKLGSVSSIPRPIEAADPTARGGEIEPSFTAKLGLASPIPQPTVQIPPGTDRTDGGLLAGEAEPTKIGSASSIPAPPSPEKETLMPGWGGEADPNNLVFLIRDPALRGAVMGAYRAWEKRQ